jgi:hypothetical protein
VVGPEELPVPDARPLLAPLPYSPLEPAFSRIV